MNPLFYCMEMNNMIRVLLDGSMMNSREMVHIYLKKELGIPGYYGNNLDALWDALSSYGQYIIIELENEKELLENLGDYGKFIIGIFEEAKEENPNIDFRIKNKN